MYTAHVEQLALGSAFSEVSYYEEWRGTVDCAQEVYVYYNGSGKKRFGLATDRGSDGVG